jgi:hypothetical protein
VLNVFPGITHLTSEKEKIAETQQPVPISRTASEDKAKHRKRRAEDDPNDKALTTRRREIMDVTSILTEEEVNPDDKRTGSPENEDVTTTIRNLKWRSKPFEKESRRIWR